jgi:CRISPR/Cas system CSM-associated protein Csm2 small subunit
MRKLPSYNFQKIKTVHRALEEIESHIKDLAEIIEECEQFDDDDRTQLVENIEWLKHFYERAEKVIREHE